jgi:hypothetical protein
VPYDTCSKLEFATVSEINVPYRHSEMLEGVFIDISKVEVAFLKSLEQIACNNIPTTNLLLTSNQTENAPSSDIVIFLISRSSDDCF